MGGVLGTLIGFGGSIVPAITDHFAKKQDQKFELQKMEKEAELVAAGYTHEMAVFKQQATDKEHERLIKHDIAISKGNGFITSLQRSVRPVITYSFFTIFAIVEISLLSQVIQSDLPLTEAMTIVWDDDTKAVWGAVMAFWFGNRALEKLRIK
jgi:hypothetical protein